MLDHGVSGQKSRWTVVAILAELRNQYSSTNCSCSLLFVLFSSLANQAATRKVSASDSPDALNACLDASRNEGRFEEHPEE